MSIKQAQSAVALVKTRLAAAVLAPDAVSARLRLGRALLASRSVEGSGQRWAAQISAQAVADTKKIFAERGWL